MILVSVLNRGGGEWGHVGVMTLQVSKFMRDLHSQSFYGHSYTG